MGPAITVDGLTKAYGTHSVLGGIGFQVGRGEIFALLGPNGAGKTTTIEILEGFRQRDAGRVEVLGTDPSGASREHRARVGIVLQSGGVEGDLTVGEAVRLAAGCYPFPNDWREVVDLVGLTAARRQRVRTLSGGEQRRLDLALGLIGNPEVLFLDEPTTGFDPEARRHAWRLLDDLRSGGMTIVLTTHYLDEVEALANHLAILHRGRIAAAGTPRQVVGRRPTLIRFRVRPDVAATLVHLDPNVRVTGDRVELRANDPTAAMHALTSWALANGHRLVELEVGQPHLEDVYLELIGRRRG
jgi:ABC-2 type transport system ATP-binding protein